MTTFDTGRKAETAAVQFLQQKGFSILAQNWRTKSCEIDIIAQRGPELCICEVKYRATNRQGTGLDYITPKKLQQMRFAAQSWAHIHNWQGEYELAVIEVSGPNFKITAAIKGLD